MENSYIHRVHYYETDKMAVVHHSNYIRWMEEARVAYLDGIGAGFADMEARGVLSPVIGVEGRYLRPCRFDDRVRITVRLTEFKGVRLRVAYEMFNETTGETVFTGTSDHCFTDAQGKLIILKKLCPEADAALRAAVTP
jgi:acyl-CoA thioester hydrolase